MYFHSSIYTKFKKKNISPSFEPLNLSTFPPGPQPPYAFHFFDQNPVVKHFVTSVFTGNKSWSGEARSNHQCLIVIRKLFIKYTPKKLKHVPLKKGPSQATTRKHPFAGQQPLHASLSYNSHRVARVGCHDSSGYPRGKGTHLKKRKDHIPSTIFSENILPSA